MPVTVSVCKGRHKCNDAMPKQIILFFSRNCASILIRGAHLRLSSVLAWLLLNNQVLQEVESYLSLVSPGAKFHFAIWALYRNNRAKAEMLIDAPSGTQHTGHMLTMPPQPSPIYPLASSLKCVTGWRNTVRNRKKYNILCQNDRTKWSCYPMTARY